MKPGLPKLPARPPRGHKGTFGTVCVVGGQALAPKVMIGGPAFSAMAALRSGAGLAVLAVPRPIMSSALVIAPSATGLALPVDQSRALKPSEVAALLDKDIGSFDCLAVGPGWGDGHAQQQIIARLITQAELPMVIDADAINAMSQHRDIHLDFRAPAVLTPHPGEYRRLAGSLGIDADPAHESERIPAAEALARRLGCVVVLKGAESVITDGQQTTVNQTGNVALATAGTGDVLTGIIAGLIAQFSCLSLGSGARQVSPEAQGGLSLIDCARIGVHIHGSAADIWCDRHGASGLTAQELIDLVPEAMASLAREAS